MSSLGSTPSISAGHRRLAYQCLRCLHRYDTVTIDAKYRIQDHFMVKHVPLDEVPFYCRLCQFRARRKEDLESHVSKYPRHRAVLKEKGVEDSGDFLVVNQKPYHITDKDIAPLSSEQSQKHWQEKSKGRPDLMQLAVDAIGLDLTPEPMATAPATESPITNPVIEVSQILQPLQQLVNIFGGGATMTGLPNGALSTSPAVICPSATQPKTPSQVELNAVPPHPAAFDDLTVNTEDPVMPGPSMQAKSSPLFTATRLPDAATSADPLNAIMPRAPSPVPSVAESAGVFAGMPTREECQALNPNPSHAPSSSSGSSSTSPNCGHHEQILQEIRELRDAVFTLQDHFLRQYGSIHELATRLLNMAGQMVPSSRGAQESQVQQTKGQAHESSSSHRETSASDATKHPLVQRNRPDRSEEAVTRRRDKENRRYQPDYRRADRRHVVHRRH